MLHTNKDVFLLVSPVQKRSLIGNVLFQAYGESCHSEAKYL